jgi:hypothetical protein
MATYLTETVYRFCTRDLYSFFLQNKPAYLWIARHWVEGAHETELINLVTFRAVFTHYLKRGRVPGSINNLVNYIRHNPDNVAEFERTELIEDDLRDLATYEPDDSLDDQSLFDNLLAEARKRFIVNQCRVAASIATGAQQTPDKLKDTGPSAAQTWLRGEFAKDFKAEAPAVAGLLHENIPTVLQNLEDKLKPESGDGRFPLGLSHIDRCVTVGKNNLRFIGIVGMSGDGKTTLTNYICYNWLRQGAHVLYCSTEHSPEEIWEFMAFLHQSHPDYPFTLPSIADWDNRLVTPEDQHNMNKILVDIQDRKNLPGLLDCQQFRDLDSIVDYLNQNHKRNKYDCLIIDYLGRLTVPGDPRFAIQATTKMVHDVQGLAQEFDGHKGLIILTPIQVNREGNKAAKRAEEGEARYDLNAIRETSAYQHDLDLALTVWSDEDMKCGDQIEIQQIKQRKGRRAPIVKMTIDTASGSFSYVGAQQEAKADWDRTPDNVGFSYEEIGI